MATDIASNERQVAGRILWVGPADALAGVDSLLRLSEWESITAHSPVGALKQLRGEGGIDVVAMVPGVELAPLAETCRGIKFDTRSSQVAVAFLLSQAHAERAGDLLECGADECVPMSAPEKEIQLRLRNVIRVKQATDSMENASVMIMSLARAIEGKDAYTCGHVERVAAYSVEIGRKIGLSEDLLQALRTGGVVHDIGKVGIPDHVLNKPGKLTDEEFAVMARHPVIGYDILRPMRTFADVLPIVRWHHEKPNGKGYPDKLKGDEIPMIARVAAVADWFDALTTDRPYRKAFSIGETLRITQGAADNGDLDPALVNALLQVMNGETAATMAALVSTAARAA
jgi:putative two-component system response regulator